MKDLLLPTNKLKSITSLFVLSLFLCTTLYGQAGAVLPFTQDDLDFVNKGQNFRDPQANLSCFSTDNTRATNVYILGDSWAVRLQEAADPNITDALASSGITVTKVNASVGRSISGGGEAEQNALEAVAADEAEIRRSDTVLIVLGTNADDYDAKIPELLDALNAMDVPNIVWVNTAANADDAIAEAAGEANAAIQKYSAQDRYNYRIVDFFTLAFPGDPTPDTVPVGLDSSLLDSDGIHPKIPEGVDMLINATKAVLGGISGGATASNSGSSASLPEVAKQRLAGVESLVRQNQPIYEQLASQYGLPWQVFGALHYREAGSKPDYSMLDGKPFGEQATDSENIPLSLKDSGDAAFEIFKGNAAGFYDVEVGPSMSFQDLQYAFLAYNRGGLYKNVPPEEGGPWEPTLSPYVMNLYDENYVGVDGQGMEWPRGTSGNSQGRVGNRRWGETASGVNNPPGTMTFIAYFGFTPAGSSGCGAAALSAGQLQWPVLDGETAVGRVTACWSDLRHKTVSGGSYYHSGVDIAAAGGTKVVSVQNGTVVFAGTHSSYGNLVIVDHGTGIWSHYGHLASIDPAINESVVVAAGSTIGGVGNTGVSLGNHLHLNMYNTWPFGSLPQGAANTNGQETINPFTNGLSIPESVPDEVGCMDWPNGGREEYIAL